MLTNAQVEQLVTDTRFQSLKYHQEKTNVFSVVGQTHTEHWHSSFMSWLLDAHSSLRLGHFPLARLLNLYIIKNPDCGITLQDIYDWDLDAVKFQTEKDASMNGKKRSIDVYGESDELIIVIENKVNARENYNNSTTGQTQDYYDYVEAHKTDKQKVIYFFVTANPKQNSYADMFEQVTYQEMYDSIISKCIEHPQVSEDGKYLLEQYAENLRETIHNTDTPMALVNVNICKSLYADYTEELDEIFCTVEGADEISRKKDCACIVYYHYKDIFDEIYQSLREKYGRTPRSRMQRQNISFTDLYLRGKVTNGMKFTMKYDNVVYHARASVSSNGRECFLQVLDENEEPYMSEEGDVLGLYESSSTAGVDLINAYRRKHNIPEHVQTLRGTTYWVNEEGKTILQLMEEI